MSFCAVLDKQQDNSITRSNALWEQNFEENHRTSPFISQNYLYSTMVAMHVTIARYYCNYTWFNSYAWYMNGCV